jgi:hypothetical protein
MVDDRKTASQHGVVAGGYMELSRRPPMRGREFVDDDLNGMELSHRPPMRGRELLYEWWMTGWQTDNLVLL